MKTWSTGRLILPLLILGACSPDEHSGNASRSAPAAYIPPPENVKPAPEKGSGEWIGPGGFESKPSSDL